MESRVRETSAARSGFVLGGWLVQPSLGRISSGRETVHLEPRVMDLLVVLAESVGEVVTREELLEEVWEGRFISDATLTAAVGELRRILHDDARHPRFIETVPKRGYRLVASVIGIGEVAETAAERRVEQRPYPGLEAYAEGDRDLFFGREEEIDEVLRKLDRRNLMALIGPSGSGKTSFLRAGLLPALPRSWSSLLVTPGRHPRDALAEALLDGLIQDTEAVLDLLHFDDDERALAALGRWRRQFGASLLVVDQFEELFTLHDRATRASFATLIGKAASELDIQVLLSLRDDFFFRCHELPELREVFDEVTPFAPLQGASLRRALLRPAEALGYRFEDEALVQEILDSVDSERGALPLVAFTASRLWEERDPEGRLLTWTAYREIGGLVGALGSYAESVLSSLGPESLPVVREIFRNLCTALGTRSVMDREELLSIFDSRRQAEAVLQTLVQSRLLTSFEKTSALSSRGRHSGVEIIHESLLSAWPRLVRWLTQDAEGAQLRDELRQAAELWEQHGRPDDRLWNGTAYQEFVLWRERYPGGLTDSETDFATAMIDLVERQKRRKKRIISAAFTLLLAVLVAVSLLWTSSEKARGEADRERVRAEAANLLSLAQLQEETSLQLAYASASLELHDHPGARRSVLESIAGSPPELRLPELKSFAYSPDGRWMALTLKGRLWELWPRDRGEAVQLASSEECAFVRMHNNLIHFSPDSERLAIRCCLDGETEVNASHSHEIRVWSIPEGELLGSLPNDPRTEWFVAFEDPERVVVRDSSKSTEETIVQTFSSVSWLDPRDRVSRGRLEIPSNAAVLGVPDSFSRAFSPDGHSIRFANPTEPTREIGIQRQRITKLASSGRNGLIASLDDRGDVHIWTTTPRETPIAVLTGGQGLRTREMGTFSPNGRYLVGGGWYAPLKLWDLHSPPDFEPVDLGPSQTWASSFSPDNQWLALEHMGYSVLRPIRENRARVLLRADNTKIHGLAFGPESHRLYGAEFVGNIEAWALGAFSDQGSQTLYRGTDPENGFVGRLYQLAVDPEERFLAVSGNLIKDTRSPIPNPNPPGLLLFPIEPGEEMKKLSPLDSFFNWSVAIDYEGRRVATSHYFRPEVLVTELESGNSTRFELPDSPRPEDALWPSIPMLAFTPEGHVLASTLSGGFWRLDPSSGDKQKILEGIATFGSSRDGKRIVGCSVGQTSFHDLETGESRILDTHGRGCLIATTDPAGQWAVSAGYSGGDVHGDLVPELRKGVLRIGPVDGSEPRLLVGHESDVITIAFSPDGHLLASADEEGTIRLWPITKVAGPPVHRLPLQELLDHIRSLTNARVVRDESGSADHRVIWEPLTRWPETPRW